MPIKYIPIFPLIPEQVKKPIEKRKAPELVLELPIAEYDIPKLDEKKISDEKKWGETIIGWDQDDLDFFIID